MALPNDIEGGALAQAPMRGGEAGRDAQVWGSALFHLAAQPNPPGVLEVQPPTSGPSPTPSTPLTLDVNTQGLADYWRVELLVKYAHSSRREVVYDGTAFAPDFAATSTVQPFHWGLRFFLLPVGGWPDSPTITFRAVHLPSNG